MSDIQRHLRRLFDAGSAVGLSDGELLERLVATDSESAEAAVETILARHGSTVLTVCRQVLGDVHAAEDAFQATFLVLIRRAGSLRIRENGSLGSWLYGVAYRTALKARRSTARRRAREHRVAVPEAKAGPWGADGAERDELGTVLHDEVNRLPARYRVPVVLCYFEGRTHDEAAATLQWPVGTVRSNLSRARDLLRSRLTGRGLAPAGLIGATRIKSAAQAEVPAALRTATVAAAIQGTPAATAAALMKLMLRDLFMARLKVAIGGLSAMTLLVASIGFAVQGARRGKKLGPEPVPVAVIRPRPDSADRPGDPLPRFARARLGDLRFHHGDWVKEAVYTPDGQSLVTLDQRGLVRVWDAATGRIIRGIGEQGLAFGEIAVSPDGRAVATVGSPTGLRLWDLASGQERRRWHKAQEESYADPRLSPDGRTIAVAVTRYHDAGTGQFETFIDLLDTAAPTERRRRIRGDWLRLGDLRFSPDGQVLATASNDSGSDFAQGKAVKGSTRLWDVATTRELCRFPVVGASVGLVAFSPDGRRLAAAVSDETIRFYDRMTGQEDLPRLRGENIPRPEPARPHPDWAGLATHDFMTMHCLVFSPDGTILASGSGGSGSTGDAWVAGVYLWDVGRGRELRRLPGHLGWIHSVSFSPDGRTLATTGPEVVVRLWDVASGRETLPQSGHRSSINLLVVSPADGTIFTTGQDGTIRHWDPASGRERGIFARFSASINGMAIAPDGKTLFVGERFGAVTLWDVVERREIRRFARNQEDNAVWHVAFAPDGQTIASGWKVWDVASGQVLATFQDRDPRNKNLARFSPIFYTPDGKQLIASEPEGVRIWDIASGKEVRWAVRTKTALHRVALSHDRRFLASGGEGPHFGGRENDPSIHVWELASGQEVAKLSGHEEGTWDLDFSPDGRLLASGSGTEHTTLDATVRIWDLATGRERRRLDGHLAAVKAVAFTPDGRSVVSGSEDGTALVWDVSDCRDEVKSDEPLNPESLQSHWNTLAGNDAHAAYQASWTLSVPSTVPFLRDHLKAAAIAEPNAAPEALRRVRAITALDRIGTAEARGVLERLAQGNPDAIETREARSTLVRMERARGR
jgi:RNA polymerase sigma factor (sigma-70 family)